MSHLLRELTVEGHLICVRIVGGAGPRHTQAFGFRSERIMFAYSFLSKNDII